MGSGSRPKATSGRAPTQKIKKQDLHRQPVPSVDHAVPVGIQQSILNIFTQAFPIVSQQVDFKKVMQEVKGHLFNRDFDNAFGKQEYLDVYASRWSAARALAYADILTHPDRLCWYQNVNTMDKSSHTWSEQGQINVVEQGSCPSSSTFSQNDSSGLASLSDLRLTDNGESNNIPPGQNMPKSLTHGRLKIACVGGGAGAEIVAFAATLRYLQEVPDRDKEVGSSVSSFDILAIDIADWSTSVEKISSALTTCPPLPDYASQATRDANRAFLLNNQVAVSFSRQNILQMSLDQLRNTLQDVSLVTIMFTLNELFSSSLAKTTALLLNLTEVIEINSRLIVVDSPGSYSEIKLGKSQNQSQNVKKYPMKWLLDHTLLDVAGKDADTRWVKIEDEDSKWFRVNDKLGLRYGIDLENCRYQIHVFRKLK